MTAIRSARERARAEIRTEILAMARHHLAEHGAAGLSLRAVARDLEIVPSAVYRYFENRDALLTALIVQAYDGLGDACDGALAKVPRKRSLQRWLAVARQVREWAISHPHEYALLYGTPVPGYRAPEDTIGPGTRVSLALVSIVADAHTDAALQPEPATMTKATRQDVDALIRAAAPEVPADSMFWLVLAWTQLFGLVSFELFGQTKGLISRGDTVLADAATTMAKRIGLRDL